MKLPEVSSRFTSLFAPLLRGRLMRFRVAGRSMLRAYAPGDRVLVESWSYARREPRVGEVVVVRQPGGDGRRDLKRIVAGPGAEVTVRGDQVRLGAEQWYVLGDNLSESTDSRQNGPVDRRDIIGRVWFKY